MDRLTADRKSKLVSDLVHAAPQFTQAASTQSTEKTAEKELANQIMCNLLAKFCLSIRRKEI